MWAWGDYAPGFLGCQAPERFILIPLTAGYGRANNRAMKTPYTAYLADAAKRRAIAIRLRDQGKTLAFIGDKLGITRARVHQIVNAGKAKSSVE